MTQATVNIPGRVLMVTTVPRTAQAFLLPYASSLRHIGWQVDLATGCGPCAEDIVQAFDNIKSISWDRTLRSVHKLFRAWREMRALLRQGKYDIVHVHTPIAAAVTRLAAIGFARTERARLVYTAHGFHFHRNGSWVRNEMFAGFEKIAGRWTDVLIVINEDDEREALRRRLIARGTVFYTPGIGITARDYAPRSDRESVRSALRQKLGLADDAKLIVMIAEFNPGKRHETAIRALAALDRKDAHMMFAGTGPTMVKIRELADRLGLRDRCHFLGYCNNVRELLVASDVLILPSEREGLARCVMEAMAAQVPVIGADSRGIADLLRGGCGMLHAVGNDAQLARAIGRVLGDATVAFALVTNAAIRIADYEYEKLIPWHEELYSALLKKAPTDELPVRRLPKPSSDLPHSVAPRLAIVAGVSASLINFRWDLLVGLRGMGVDIVAIAGDFDPVVRDRLATIHIPLRSATMQRAGMSPLADVKYYFRLVQLLKEECPDLVLAYTHKPVIHSAFCKKRRSLRHIRCYGLITGLGYSFVDAEYNWRRRFARIALSWLYRRSLTWSDGVMFQNDDDLDLFRQSRILPRRLPLRVIAGSGVNTKAFQPVAPPSTPMFLLVARLLVDKGIREFITAATDVKQKYPEAKFVLVGGRDANPRCMPEQSIAAIRRAGVVEMVGAVDDVRPYLAACSVFVLPSYREGTPRTVLEAMAVGRAIITTDTAGCRDTVAECAPLDARGIGKGRNGFLVRLKSAFALAAAMEQCISQPDMVKRMGEESRRIAETKYNAEAVNRSMIEFMGIVPSPRGACDIPRTANDQFQTASETV